MGAPLKIAATVTLDPSQAKVGAKETQVAIGGIGQSAQEASSKLQRLIETSVGIGAGAANNNMREWSGALAMAGRSADELRAKYNPLFAAISQYKQNVIEIRTLTAQGVLTTDEMTAAIQRQRQATLASIDAIKGRNAVMGGQSSAGADFAAKNAMFQFQDIAMTSAMGMNPLMVGLQQGSQLAGGFAGMSLKEATAATLGGLAGLVSPVSLITIGLTAATAAAIQFVTSLDFGAKKANKALEDHEDFLHRLKAAYGEAAVAANSYYSESLKQLQQEQKERAKDLGTILKTGATNAASTLLNVPASDFGGNTKIIADVDAAVTKLQQSTKNGAPDLRTFIDSLIEIENLPATPNGIRKIIDQIRESAKEALTAQEALKPLLATYGGFLTSQQKAADMDGYTKFQKAQEVTLQRGAASLSADLAGLNARSVAEKIAAARAAAAAQFNDGETAAERQQRINNAGVLAGAQAEKELAEAKRDRLRSIDQTLESARLELTLIGQTTSSMEAQRMELRLLTEAKTAAEKAGTTVSADEIERIKQAAAEYGRLQEAIKATNILRDQSDSIKQQQLEISLIGQSEAVRARALALAEAEKQIRDQGITATSLQAQQIRANAAALADEGLKLNRLRDAWNTVQSAGEDAIDRIGEALRTGDWAGAAEAVVADIQKSFITLGVTNPLKNAIFGTNYGTLSDAGGLLGQLFGGSGASVAGASAVGAMNVSAGTVIVNGGIAGNSFAPGNLLGGIGGAANQNLAGDMAKYAAAIRSIESGGDYSIVGPMLKNGDQALGGYQVMRSNLASWTQSALGRSLSQSEFLSSPAAQDAVFAKYFGGSLAKYGNPQDAASVWFTGRPMSSGAGASDVLGTTGAQYVQKFNTALGQVTNTAGQFGGTLGNASSGLTNLSSGLNSMGSGLSDFGKSLTSYFPQAPSSSGGEIGGLFSKLFGSVFVPNGAQATLAASGSIFGLFDDGGYTGPGGKYDPAGLVHRGEVVWSQEDIARSGGVGIVEFARRRGLKGYADGGVVYDVGPSYRAGANSNTPASQPISLHVNNYSSAEVKDAKETTDERGGRHISFTVAEQVGNALSKKGGAARKTMEGEYRLRSRGIRR